MTTADASLSPTRLRALGTAYRQARVLLSAVELGVVAALVDQPLDAETLAARLGVHERGARDLFDALVALGVLDRRDDRYRPTVEAAAFLDPAQPTAVTGALSARDYALWTRLTEALRSGQPQVAAAGFGNEQYGLVERYLSPDFVREYTAFHTGNTRDSAAIIARAFPWSTYQTYVDIGTAAGNLPVQVALAQPHITGGGFDMPPVRPAFEEYVAAHGLADRLQFYPGDFFVDPLPTADVLSLSNVLHDFGVEQRQLLIRKAYAALPVGGALVVFERFLDDERRTNVPGFLVGLQMHLYTAAGANFTGAECRTWMHVAGFTRTEQLDLGSGTSVAVGTK